MPRFDLTPSERSSVELAREALADAQDLDMRDHREVVRTLGRMEAVAVSLLRILDSDGAP